MLSTKKTFINLWIAISISLIGATLQILLIYFMLKNFGSEFNGYVRITMLFAALIATADSGIGIVTMILLVKPMQKGDWISANEIYSASKRMYRKSAISSLVIAVAISFLYPVFIHLNLQDIGSILHKETWQNGITLTGTSKDAFASINYFQLVFITLVFSTRNFIPTFFGAAEENVIAADQQSFSRKAIILFSEVFVYSIILMTINISTLSPVVTFSLFWLIGPIKLVFIWIFVKKNYVWLKYRRGIVNQKMNLMSFQLSKSGLGVTLMLSSDILLVILFFGAGVSSTLSLYMIVALNVQAVMMNFIISFREYFTNVIAKQGRLKFETYAKYELYTFAVAAFTFINLAILMPYFVSSMYYPIVRDEIAGLNESGDITSFLPESNAMEFMFTNTTFSMLIAASTSLVIVGESQNTLIQAKGKNYEISNVQNSIGLAYFFSTLIALSIIVLTKPGNNSYIIIGITVMYSLKIFFLFVRSVYLSIYCSRYLAYSATSNFSTRNILVLIVPIVIALTLNYMVVEDIKSVKDYIDENQISFLLQLALITISSSFGLIIVTSFICSPKLIFETIAKIPLVSKIIDINLIQKISDLTIKTDESDIHFLDIEKEKEASSNLTVSFDNEEVRNSKAEFENVTALIDNSDNLIYKVKGER
ncbi:hypothetical protein STIUS_v1c05890 [Spiroplasma sp. TIUS-1]|uniref:hypothetical protein n=1 Tax=Spiroplasma sp. TIUS-1 TaxID=216963 RepID=UPI001398B5FC|nr:hypothetical protein [Spiroplasma sp. TIUS-1]QHX36143.1 hypothetical protein STIUS_v1c05890 [Spiroplasma sp. TIUS-1]